MSSEWDTAPPRKRSFVEDSDQKQDTSSDQKRSFAEEDSPSNAEEGEADGDLKAYRPQLSRVAEESTSAVQEEQTQTEDSDPHGHKDPRQYKRPPAPTIPGEEFDARFIGQQRPFLEPYSEQVFQAERQVWFQQQLLEQYSRQLQKQTEHEHYLLHRMRMRELKEQNSLQQLPTPQHLV